LVPRIRFCAGLGRQHHCARPAAALTKRKLLLKAQLAESLGLLKSPMRVAAAVSPRIGFLLAEWPPALASRTTVTRMGPPTNIELILSKLTRRRPRDTPGQLSRKGLNFCGQINAARTKEAACPTSMDAKSFLRRERRWQL